MKTLGNLNNYKFQEITVNELFSLEGGKLHTTIVKEGNVTRTIYTNKSGDVLGVVERVPTPQPWEPMKITTPKPVSIPVTVGNC